MPRLTLVPWEPSWLDHQTLDLHAIYRRPRRDPLTWTVVRDADGLPIWDLVGPMTIRNHNKYRAKGFEYVTLGRSEDVLLAGNPSIQEKGALPLGAEARPPGEHVDTYLRQPGLRGPWDATAYQLDMAEAREERIARIKANVAEHGPELAEAFERQTDPGYTLPASYRDVDAETPAEPPKRKRGRPRKVAEPVVVPDPEPATA